MSQSIAYRTVGEFAYARIREQILSGELTPAQRVDQDALARDLGVSRMPIREALRRLETEHLVVITPHRGVTVAPLSSADLQNLYMMRIALESLAGRLGAMQMSNTEFEYMRSLIADMEVIVARNDPVAWLEVDWTFHSTLYTATRSHRMVHHIKVLRDEAGRYRRISLARQEELRLGLDGHRAILDACDLRDGSRVERIIRTTLGESRDKLLSLVPDGGLPLPEINITDEVVRSTDVDE